MPNCRPWGLNQHWKFALDRSHDLGVRMVGALPFVFKLVTH